jgi:hypothetical protein
MPILEDTLDMVEYPYHGKLYVIGVDEDAPLYEQEEKETLVFETDCDIQRTAKLHNGNLLGANYTVYFPLTPNMEAEGTIDKFNDIIVRRGMTFRGTFYGYTVEGQVEIIRPSQLGGCSFDVKIVSEEDYEEPSSEEEISDDEDSTAEEGEEVDG